MDLEDVERQLRDRLDAIGPASRAVLMRVLMLPDHQRASRIGEFFGDPRTQTFAQLSDRSRRVASLAGGGAG